MSLRREVHSAFDVIAPPLGGLPERVVQTVLAEQKARRRKERMLLRLRAPISLVAVFLLVALVAAVFIGGRLIQDWNAFHKPVNSAPTYQDQVASLEARPLTLPILAAGDSCPNTNTPITTDIGAGPQNLGTNSPVTVDVGAESGDGWGSYWNLTYYTAANLKGPVLIRGRDLRDPSRKLVAVGDYATGPVVGSDPQQDVRVQHAELVLDAGNPPSRRSNYDGVWKVRQGLPSAWSGCVGFQIDSADFTEIITGGS